MFSHKLQGPRTVQVFSLWLHISAQCMYHIKPHLLVIFPSKLLLRHQQRMVQFWYLTWPLRT